MKVLKSWLNEYVKIDDLSEEEVAMHLTSLGLEVEQIIHFQQASGPIVVGLVTDKSSHPDADSLHVLKIVCGTHGEKQVITNVGEIEKDLIVAVALNKARLANDITIKNSKVRGVPSQGMLCGQEELGIESKTVGGVVVFPTGTKVGTPVFDIIDQKDFLFELSITPNRGDCFGVIGIARDLAAKLDRPLVLPTLNEQNFDDSLKTSSDIKIKNLSLIHI